MPSARDRFALFLIDRRNGDIKRLSGLTRWEKLDKAHTPSNYNVRPPGDVKGITPTHLQCVAINTLARVEVAWWIPCLVRKRNHFTVKGVGHEEVVVSEPADLSQRTGWARVARDVAKEVSFDWTEFPFTAALTPRGKLL